MPSIHSLLLLLLPCTILVRADTPVPALKSTSLQGVAIDPNFQRDSCLSTSTLINGRALWVCRDTEILINQSLPLLFEGQMAGFLSSSASWSDQNQTGLPSLVAIPQDQGQTEVTGDYTQQLLLYGNNANVSYIIIQPDECNSNQAGSCSDGTRYPIWPNNPPVVTSVSPEGQVTMYFYIRIPHITDSLGVVNLYPPASLYKIIYDPNVQTAPSDLPTVSIVDEYFWPDGQFNYGDFGSLVSPEDGMLYLWAASYQSNVALARVPTDSVEDKNTYSYYYNNGTWSDIPPTSVNDTSVYITAGGGGQGTYLYSDYFNCFVWLGQANAAPAVADLYVSTAPKPEGPWTNASYVHSYPNGNASQPAYTLVAHPELSPTADRIYISYTFLNEVSPTEGFYETPLYLVEWE